MTKLLGLMNNERTNKGVFCAVLSRRWIDSGLLFLRIVSGIMVMLHGFQKINTFDQLVQTFADPIGLGPKFSLILVILAEVGAAAFVILGLLTRAAAAVLCFSMAVAAFIAHAPFTIPGSELPLLYLLIFLTIVMTGGGRFSLDTLIARRFCTTA